MATQLRPHLVWACSRQQDPSQRRSRAPSSCSPSPSSPSWSPLSLHGRYCGSSKPRSQSLCLESSSSSSSSSSSVVSDETPTVILSQGGSGDGGARYNGDGGDNGGNNGGNSGGNEGGGSNKGSEGGGGGGGGLLGAFIRGWKARVQTDPQFPFKVVMEEVIGVGACVLGDMASRPNFGLNELDFVFSTIVVGAILNFTLMYMLAPVGGSVTNHLPSIFASCPPGHMFESGSYGLLERLGTFVYKGVLFSTVGFAAGIVGTGMSNLLLSARKKVDPSFQTQNEAPPTVLNAATWALHMGLSSNFRYQAINGIEFRLAQLLTPTAFKGCVFFTRGLNNVLGGVSFVTLARLTGSQKAPPAPTATSTPTPPPAGEPSEKKELFQLGNNR